MAGLIRRVASCVCIATLCLTFASASTSVATTTAEAADPVVPVCFSDLQAFSVLPSDPAFLNLTRIQQPALSPSDEPAFLALPNNEADVESALACATQNGLQVTIKGGGHSFAAYSRVPAPGFVISLERMTAVTLDESTHIVRVAGAAKWEDVYGTFATSNNTYQVVGGLCPTVGVIGYTSGGGVGPLARMHGLAADNVIAFRLTLSNGSDTLSVDQTNHPDLFWAVRGSGGGQFGVITELTFQAHIGVRTYSWGTICYSNQTAEALSYIAAYANSLPLWLNMDAEIDDPNTICLWIVAAQPQNVTLAALAPFLVGNPQVELNEKNCFWETIQAFAEAKGYSAYSDSPFLLNSVLLPDMNSDALNAIVSAAAQFPADMCGQSLIQFGGRISQVSSDQTAFPWRNSQYMLYASCGFNNSDPTSRPAAAAGMDAWAKTVASVAKGAYVNFVDRNLENWAESYYGDNYDRLVAIKQNYNPPGGPLRFPQEIGSKNFVKSRLTEEEAADQVDAARATE